MKPEISDATPGTPVGPRWIPRYELLETRMGRPMYHQLEPRTDGTRALKAIDWRATGPGEPVVVAMCGRN